ncbi:MAG: diacylglycerol kinase family protein [Candidatus Roizmanbacteria bacterium]|nr:diacylglycerol kinase family protein [Candidatus Roizmanbacteria bacterium]
MLKSFAHAIDGIAAAFQEHQNFRIHTVTAIVVIMAGFAFQISRIEFLIIIFTINLMFIVEMVNTSVEEITNLVTIKWAKQAKIAKDVAAGMALLTAVSSVVVGIVIFVPYLIELMR